MLFQFLVSCLVSLFLLNCLHSASANKNGIAITPPMGWRSWTHYAYNVSQELMISTVAGLTSRKRLVDGKPTSLADVGYIDVGLDDAWQACGGYGPKNFTFHDADGFPQIDLKLFPDMKNFTNYAHDSGLTAGWYLNNCKCKDHCGYSPDDPDCYFADVSTLYQLGFDGVKLDACSGEMDLNRWTDLLNNLDRPMLVENCHWGSDTPNATWCPYNFYRASGDLAPTYSSIIENLQSIIPFARQNLSTPGCWSYPDMLQIATWFIDPFPALNIQEERSHFAAWCIVSSPLYIGFDVSNDTTVDPIWDIVTNREAIAINQAYFGHSGGPFAQSINTVTMSVPRLSSEHRRLPNYQDYISVDSITVPQWQAFYKTLSYDHSYVGVVVLNEAEPTVDIAFAFAEIPDLQKCASYKVHDVWTKKDIGDFSDAYVVKDLVRHDAAFLTIRCNTPTIIAAE